VKKPVLNRAGKGEETLIILLRITGSAEKPEGPDFEIAPDRGHLVRKCRPAAKFGPADEFEDAP